MSPLAILLVLSSGLLHALWNYLLKRADDKLVSSWFLFVAGGLALLPFGVVMALREAIDPVVGWCVLGSSVAFTVYAALLARSYERGDISLAYPISRAVGPLATVAFAVTLLGERPTPAGYAAVGLLVVGTMGLSWPRDPEGDGQPPGALRRHLDVVLWAAATGLSIAVFSIIDKVGVELANPLSYLTMTYLGTGVLMFPVVLLRRGWTARGAGVGAVAREGRRAIREALAAAGRRAWLGGLLSASGYALTLFAFRLAPAGYVIALRSTSVLFAVLLGSRLLGEQRGGARLLFALLMVLGLALMALYG